MSPVMDKRLTVNKPTPHPVGMKWIALVVLLCVGLLAWLGTNHLDPYINDVLSLDGDTSRGQAIFQANCAVCHGIEARGNIGPSLIGVHQRKSDVHLIEQVISGKTPPMPQFQPNPQEMADLLDYLKSL